MKNIGDYFPILIAVAFGLFQLFRFLGKGGSEKPKSPPPTDPFGGKKEPDWGDLMEALGQKPKPKNSGPIPPPVPMPRIEPVVPKMRSIPSVPPQNFPPPSRPLPVEMARAKAPEVPAQPYEFYQPKIAEASELKFKNFDSENAEASKAPSVISIPLAGLPANRMRHFLANQDRLREAVILSEILNKPLALR